MKVLALVSGGKDSCFNMMKCVENGHEIVALAHLKPKDADELDSYMYQSVGHEIIDHYAEAMGLPLFQGHIVGKPYNQASDYEVTEGDEVEDLFKLMTRAKESVDYEAVSVGAIFSDYQRVRVLNVCKRLGVTMLAYLWHRDQSQLLREMVDCGVRAIIIKVAALGLEPHKHLGKTLAEIYDHMISMEKKYGLNVCGEGGEYETATLDCPLFRRRIVVDESEVVIHSDDAFAPVGYLKIKRMHLEDKPNCEHGLKTSSEVSLYY
ncbi:diphthine--ammonia ligase isoform X1 [Rhipicephalus sanguineus]|uniref:diphthine--ammonia ligase isoform X1 n=1 Tax=Rhipicephalus sanguineus TaxID=34632 RepID=UPI0018944AD1|nr:diphthine--ammonia ligase isoform X1 [Rhipicephalus sanguineus]